ncbi:hypothetical protein SNK03_003587 [Fusarium graminearum]|uniref:Chromosome 1, complete genome n=1 Tax=Gibberella zeae (strain ATCC MYA-4620 / CBS 123657 / FGSC 9075 / NRRL 31084 / PH-1) TaxID=229533 RepID=I1S0I5_GIBZE|nr:hypothetical protein FGSG_10213 [Fusarium graminearum PH-1]EYB25840.1 hypothetical protein FG05_10213 [Fusarium graminearum]ESU16898.1 hypothetical protein FGSG_10213 [Fusarium graminearum PH-1]CAF3516610.1 unnamed protein product [Fusarium graminearum]CAF3610139.1 unnamed protein product [Fusarium graminearum]CAG1973524.1 unnamed protein product [Fusarium graminearum]|eukprot:XP_011319160.1 hypothetical protein FGSG_10213 [Fusarium graminearum PH-1]
MAIIFEDQLDRLKGGESSEFAHARSEILRPAYDLYLESAHVRQFSPPPSILQLIASPDIAVKLSRCRKTGAAIDLTITKKSNASYENFMGYCKEHRCVVFKGETGLFYDFVDFVESAAAKHGINDITAVLRAPDKIRIPFGGLKYGLEYEQFVDLVEVLQCAMWIRTSPSDSRTPPPSTPEYVPSSPSGSLMTYETIHERPGVPSQSLSDSDSPLSSCGSSISTPPPFHDMPSICSDDSSSDDSSELSDPPMVINTPPWLRFVFDE